MVLANSQMRYLRYLETLQSEMSAEVMFLPTGSRFKSLKLHLLMCQIPLIMQPITSTRQGFYSENWVRTASFSSDYWSTTGGFSSSGSGSGYFFYTDVVSLSSSLFCLRQSMTDSKRLSQLWFMGACCICTYSADSQGGDINLKGSVVFTNSFSSERVTLVFWLRSIILCRKYRKFSSRREEDFTFFMRMGMAVRLDSSSACRYSLQLAVFFLRQGWKPKMIQQRQVPSEYISLFQLGKKRLDFSFSGGMQEIVPFLVVVSLHSLEISDTPKSHSLNTLPFLRMFTGLMSSCTIPASSSVIRPLVTWQKRSQISSSVSGAPNLSVRQLIRVPDSQYSWKMYRLFLDSRCSLCVLTRLGQLGKFWIIFNSFRYSFLTSSLSMRITLTANTFPGSVTCCARQTFAYFPSPMGLGESAYRSSTPVS